MNYMDGGGGTRGWQVVGFRDGVLDFDHQFVVRRKREGDLVPTLGEARKPVRIGREQLQLIPSGLEFDAWNGETCDLTIEVVGARWIWAARALLRYRVDRDVQRGTIGRLTEDLAVKSRAERSDNTLAGHPVRWHQVRTKVLDLGVHHDIAEDLLLVRVEMRILDRPLKPDCGGGGRDRRGIDVLVR